MKIDKKVLQAAEFAREGRHRELEQLCRKILLKKPKQFDALQLLGLAQCELGDADTAIATLERAITINRRHAGSRINLGRAYLEKGRVGDAIRSCNKAIELDGLKYEAYVILGNALQEDRGYGHAKAAYERALQLHPSSAEALDGLGVCLKRQGQLQEAVPLHLKAIEINPALSTGYIHLFQLLMLLHALGDANEVVDAGLRQGMLNEAEKYELLVGKAKIAWLMGDFEGATKAVVQCDHALPRDSYGYGNIDNLKAYHSLIKILLGERNKCPERYAGDTEKTLLFVSESHCLAPAEVLVDYMKEQYRISSALITGCKLWHLISKEQNEYKASLELIFSTIPKGSVMVLGFGEIDCRADEGILLAYKKKGVDYVELIPNMVAEYLDYVMRLAEPQAHTLLVYGVPAPEASVLDQLMPEDQESLKEVIRLVNDSLKQGCATHQLEYLDVYAVTLGDGGKSNMAYHVDGHHMHPRVFPILFDNCSS